MFGRRETPSSQNDLPAIESLAPTLLVVDDDTVHRMILTKIGQRAGFTVTGAASYDDAVELLRKNIYHVVTLDLSLGQHGGVEVLQVLPELGFRGRIIIISGSTETVRAETAALAKRLSLDLCCSLPKPVDLAHLRTLLHEIKERRAVGLSPCA